MAQTNLTGFVGSGQRRSLCPRLDLGVSTEVVGSADVVGYDVGRLSQSPG